MARTVFMGIDKEADGICQVVFSYMQRLACYARSLLIYRQMWLLFVVYEY
ncbi:MAG: hypothetical protein LBH78_01615 [Rickettsiales bacterium]|jgi:hypothetical protein|nr:hypothetical protein [Rickettsiales bacterium]